MVKNGSEIENREINEKPKMGKRVVVEGGEKKINRGEEEVVI